jgi:predicted nucleic acid-binding protein
VAKIFIDTNILVYTVDQFDKEKQKTSRKILKEIAANETVVISTQVLQEFYNACTKKLNMNPLKAKEYIHNYIENFEVIQNGPAIIERGIDINIISHISFWDALLIAAAESSNSTEIISEDLNDGQIIDGIKIKNPFIDKQPGV